MFVDVNSARAATEGMTPVFFFFFAGEGQLSKTIFVFQFFFLVSA